LFSIAESKVEEQFQFKFQIVAIETKTIFLKHHIVRKASNVSSEVKAHHSMTKKSFETNTFPFRYQSHAKFSKIHLILSAISAKQVENLTSVTPGSSNVSHEFV
jgi:hypothetical protein